MRSLLRRARGGGSIVSKAVALRPYTADETEVAPNPVWLTLGGEELEAALNTAAVALLDAKWLVLLAEGGGVLRRGNRCPPRPSSRRAR